MGYAAYSSALRDIAANEADGEDVDDAIRRLAMSAGMDSSSVRQDVTEMADLVG